MSLWDRTQRMRRRLRWHLDEDGGYLGHPLIERNTLVKNRVYLGTFEREAIVVAPDEILIGVYVELLAMMNGNTAAGSIKILHLVYKLVRQKMPNMDPKAVEAFVKKHGAAKDGLLPLSLFVKHGLGCCRQQALLTAFLIEQLIEDAYLSDQFSVDRNETWQGGHVWVRWWQIESRPLIIDCTLGYFDWLHAPDAKPHDYRRPTDLPSPPPSEFRMTRTNVILVVLFSIVLGLTAWLSIKNHSDQQTLVTDYAAVHKSVVSDVVKTLEARQKPTAPSPAISIATLETKIARLEADMAALKLKKSDDDEAATTENLDEVQKSCEQVTPAGCSFDATSNDCQQGEDKGKVDFTDCPAAKKRMMTIRCLGKLTANLQTFSEQPHDCYGIPDEGP